MSDRDKLARIVAELRLFNHREAANMLEGLAHPVIETAEELGKLPEGSVVLDSSGLAVQRCGGYWLSIEEADPGSRLLPATLPHRGES